MLESYNEVLSIDDVCNILGIGRNFAYDLLHAGVIPNKQIRKKFIIPKLGIINYLKKISEVA